MTHTQEFDLNSYLVPLYYTYFLLGLSLFSGKIIYDIRIQWRRRYWWETLKDLIDVAYAVRAAMFVWVFFIRLSAAFVCEYVVKTSDGSLQSEYLSLMVSSLHHVFIILLSSSPYLAALNVLHRQQRDANFVRRRFIGPIPRNGNEHGAAGYYLRRPPPLTEEVEQPVLRRIHSAAQVVPEEVGGRRHSRSVSS